MRNATDRPNIILINCDDLGYGDLGCYGSPVNRTPAIDTMASQGCRFTSFYMASPVCSPSRGAMMTGCHPKRIGFDTFDNDDWVLFPGYSTGINREEATIASILKGQGYATKIVGKWHCGDQPEFLPTNYGFDSYFGLPYSNDMGRQVGGGHQWPPLPLLEDGRVLQEQPDQAALTERYMQESVRFMREKKDEPFFLYFAHMYVHLPLYAPERFLRESRNGRYGACVAGVDWSVEVLLDELRQLGIAENTLVILTSDNGSRGDRGGSNQPLRGCKGGCWEGGQRVPMIAYWPGQISEESTCDKLASAMDFLPTFARLAGTTAPGDRTIDGKDISTLLTGEGESPHEYFYYYLKDELRAVRSKKWKLHLFHEGDPMTELYDLESDIGETRNLYDKHPEIVKELAAAAQACREDIGDSATGTRGANCREPGRVDNPTTLTEFDPNHPYYLAEYDLPDRG